MATIFYSGTVCTLLSFNVLYSMYHIEYLNNICSIHLEVGKTLGLVIQGPGFKVRARPFPDTHLVPMVAIWKEAEPYLEYNPQI